MGPGRHRPPGHISGKKKPKTMDLLIYTKQFYGQS